MNPEPSDDLDPALLAAYVDGELDAPTREAVEAWLAAHPDALDELLDQWEFSPGNRPLWELVEPPTPSADAWAAMRHAIADALRPEPVAPPGRSWAAAWLVGGLAVAASVAAAAWFLVPPAKLPDGPRIVRGPEVVAPAKLAVLPMATDDDVEIHRVAGNVAAALPVGRPPLDGLMVLAEEADVELEGADPHPAWGIDGPKIMTAPGDSPMIFAATPR